MFVDRDLHFPRLLAELHKSDIDRNAGEPGGESSAALEIVQMNKCELESFLHNVFSVFMASHNALCEVKNPPLVAIEELAKGDRMPALRRSQQPRVTALPTGQVRLVIVDRHFSRSRRCSPEGRVLCVGHFLFAP